MPANIPPKGGSGVKPPPPQRVELVAAGSNPSPRTVQVVKPEETIYVAVSHKSSVPTAQEVTYAVQASLESKGYSMERIDLDVCNIIATYYQEPKAHEGGYSSVWAIRVPQFRLK